jgi:hypothetical protein
MKMDAGKILTLLAGAMLKRRERRAPQVCDPQHNRAALGTIY